MRNLNRFSTPAPLYAELGQRFRCLLSIFTQSRPAAADLPGMDLEGVTPWGGVGAERVGGDTPVSTRKNKKV